MSKTEVEQIYELHLSYDPAKDSLSDSLDFLSKVVSRQELADNVFTNCLEKDLQTEIILDDIQVSSIILKVKNILKNTMINTEEDQILEKGIKAYWHRFLIEVRKPFLEYSANNDTLQKREDLIDIRGQLVQIANSNNVNILMVESLSDEQIAQCLAYYSVPKGLSPEQEYKSIYNGEEFKINKNFNLSSDRIAQLLNGREETFKDQIVYLKPKTAVYEGDGMWDFYESKTGKVVKGKISDEIWLKKFQDGLLKADNYPFPGVVLKTRADVILKFDENNFRKGETFVITEILGPAIRSEIEQIFIEGF